MAHYVLDNATVKKGRNEGLQRPGGVVVRRDGTRLEDVVNGSRRTRLDQMIDAEIIPRLMVAHRLTDGAPASENHPIVGSPSEHVWPKEDIDAFAELILKGNTTAVTDRIDSLIALGTSLETIFLGILEPTARRFGEYWEADTVTFADVTIGLSRLQQVLRTVSPSGTIKDAAPNGHRALLAAVPGDQHTFGVFMVEEFFRRAGWDVVTCVLETTEELSALVASEAFSIVGFSISQDSLFNEMVSNVQNVYKVSMNREVQVLVGGRCFIDNPNLFKETGADGMAMDGLEAVSLADSLVRLAAPQ